MALPPGGFSPGSAGIGGGGGAYGYVAGAGYPEYFAGSFFIDTGYDDPVAWTTGVDAAEIYGARVYGASGTINPDPGAGVYVGGWRVQASPCWETAFFTAPAANARAQRVFIKCDVYVHAPVSTAINAWQRLESVNWSLYRV